MKFLRFKTKDGNHYGILEGDIIYQVEGSIYGDYKESGKTYKRSEVKLLPPCEPTKIFCIGSNYISHIQEMGWAMPEVPASFMKPITCMVASGDYIDVPKIATRVDYEGEVAIVVKDLVRNVTAEDAKKHILGVAASNDVTERDMVKAPLQLTFGKSFDTFCPIGPFIDTEVDPDNTTVRTYLNGKLVQEGETAKTVFCPSKLLAFLSQAITFYPGDVILTGTPGNVLPIKEGDTVEIEVGGMGERLSNPVRNAKN